MTPGDSEITVERLREIIELTLDMEPPEELGIAIQELVEEVVRLQLRVADLYGLSIQKRRRSNIIPLPPASKEAVSIYPSRTRPICSGRIAAGEECHAAKVGELHRQLHRLVA